MTIVESGDPMLRHWITYIANRTDDPFDVVSTPVTRIAGCPPTDACCQPLSKANGNCSWVAMSCCNACQEPCENWRLISYTYAPTTLPGEVRSNAPAASSFPTLLSRPATACPPGVSTTSVLPLLSAVQVVGAFNVNVGKSRNCLPLVYRANATAEWFPGRSSRIVAAAIRTATTSTAATRDQRWARTKLRL